MATESPSAPSKRGALVVRALLIFALLLVLVSWAATQILAKRFGYAPELGEALAHSKRFALYAPHQWFGWWKAWGDQSPELFAGPLKVVKWGAAIAALVALFSLAQNTPKATGAFGTARWSRRRELKRAGLFAESGIVLGQLDSAEFKQVPRERSDFGWVQKRRGQLLRHSGNEHIAVVAPTGGGKDMSIVNPTLLSDTSGSVFVYDLKGDSWTATAGFRKLFSHVLRLDPTSKKSVRFNPMLEIDPTQPVPGAQNLAEILVNPGMTKEQRDHWDKTGHHLLTAVILHVLYAEEDKSLRGCLRFATNPDRTMAQMCILMRDTWHQDPGAHEAIVSAAAIQLKRSANEASSILSTLVSFLTLWEDPMIAENTSESDFTVADLVCGKRPVSLYLTIPGPDADRLRVLTRVLLDTICKRLAERPKWVRDGERKRRRRHSLLMVLNEFPTLKRMPIFETALATYRGFRIRFLIFLQDIAQLEQHYGANSSIWANCRVRVLFTTSETKTTELISKMLGNQSLMREQHGTSSSGGSGAGGLFAKKSRNQSWVEYGRPLMTPEEIAHMPATHCLVMPDGAYPYTARKIISFEDQRFAERLGLPTPKSQKQLAEELPPKVVNPYWTNLPIPPYVEPEEEDEEAEESDPKSKFADLTQDLSQ